MDDYENRRRERRNEEQRYQGDVWYEVWRAGGDPDRVNPDRIQDDFYRGMDFIQAAADELKRQRQRPVIPEYLEDGSENSEDPC